MAQSLVGAVVFGSLQAWADDVVFADSRLTQCVSAAVSAASVESAVDLTTLSCNAKGIDDATGIEQLVKLEKLALFGNQLSTIDLRQLTALKELNLANNQLTRIDVSNNSALQVLYLFGNQLVSLDLQQTPALSKIKAEKNRLLVVNFGAQPKLERIYLFDNKMEDIKIDGLTALRFIDVRSNPMPDEVYDYLDAFSGVKASHDGNTEDWE
ncbi:MAG: leucine-rich repeat domain-containing protein [Pseudomonadota bacterium]